MFRTFFSYISIVIGIIISLGIIDTLSITEFVFVILSGMLLVALALHISEKLAESKTTPFGYI